MFAYNKISIGSFYSFKSVNKYTSNGRSSYSNDLPLNQRPLHYPAGIIACLSPLLVNLLAPLPTLANTFKVTSVVPSVYRQTYNTGQRRWADDVLLDRGVRLSPEDRLISKGRGTATINCQSGAQIFKSFDYVRVSSFCQSQRAAPVLAIPGSQDPSLPYLLEPRLGLVRGPTPTLRWNPVAGVSRYVIRLFRSGDPRPLWNGTVADASRITLPARANLVVGESYHLVVEADKDTSSRLEPLSAALRFGVLPASEVQQLEVDLAEIRSLSGPGITPQTLMLLEAAALEQRGLITEAFALLNQQESQKPTLEGQLQLGRLASLQGLNQQAQRHFRQAVALARQTGDGEAGHEALEGEQRALRLVTAARPNPATP